jgi:predicted transcriptional regulator with HTH domain
MISLRSSLRRKLLAHLCSNRSAQFYVRQMAAILGVDPTNLSRELLRLQSEGFFNPKWKGASATTASIRDIRT